MTKREIIAVKPGHTNLPTQALSLLVVRGLAYNIRAMTDPEALLKLECMTDQEFTDFCDGLPPRVQLLLKAGFVDWREVCPQWYIKLVVLK